MSTRDYRRIVEDIQIALSQSAVPLDAVYAMSVEYAAACDEVNVRLRECHDLLRRGLRAEALQRCDIDPKLLEVVTTLDFPELQNWVSVLAAQRLVTPPPLLVSVAGELNEAFALERPLGAIMRKHRLLALARAPLKDRIIVLRKIASHDPNSPIWDEDLRIWERTRHMEIDRDAVTALNQRDAERLGELERELRSAEWREAPTSALVQKISGMATELRIKQARGELQLLAPQLMAAYQEFDVAHGRQVRSKWLAYLANAALQSRDPLSELATPALAWLEGEDRKESLRCEFETAEARLTQALDEDLPAVELERRFNDLLRLDQGVNDQLAKRFVARMEQYRLTVARKHRLILTGLGSAVLLVAGLTVLLIVRHHRATEAAGFALALSALVEEEKLGEAGDFIQDLEAKPEHVQKDARILELIARYHGLTQAERNRQAAFRDSLAEIERNISGKPNVKMLQEGRRLLQDLQSRAVVASEENQVAHLDAGLADKIRRIEAENAMAYGQKIDVLREKVNRLKEGELLDYAQRSEAIKGLLDEAKQLTEEGRELPQALAATAGVLQVQLESLAKIEADELLQKTSLFRISEAIGNPRSFRDALSLYVKVFSKTARTQDFLKVLEKDPVLWDRITTWNAFLTKHSKMNVVNLSSGQATALATDIKAFLVDHSNFPGADELRAKLPYLESIAFRDGPSGPLKDSLILPFKDYTVAGLFFVRERDGANELNYYSPEPLKLPASELSAMPFSYIADADRSAPLKLKSLKRSEVVIMKDDKGVDWPVLGSAPQSIFAANASQKIRLLREGAWESTFQQVILDLRDSRYMDPVVKVQLMTFVMGVAGQGSSSLQTALKPHLIQLQSIASDVAVNWIDPQDPKAATARKAAQTVLDDVLPDLPRVFDDVKKELSALAQPPANRTYEWVGWLQLNTAGKWTCSQNKLPPDFAAELYLVTPSDPDDGAHFETVGKAQQGVVELTAATPAFLEGRPVFAVHVSVP